MAHGSHNIVTCQAIHSGDSRVMSNETLVSFNAAKFHNAKKGMRVHYNEKNWEVILGVWWKQRSILRHEAAQQFEVDSLKIRIWLHCSSCYSFHAMRSALRDMQALLFIFFTGNSQTPGYPLARNALHRRCDQPVTKFRGYMSAQK